MHDIDKARLVRTAQMFTQSQMKTLQHSHVMIFGLGGVGSYATEAIARMGIETLTIVDGDRFEESNMNRQLCALRSTIGLNKSTVTAERIKDINPNAMVNAIHHFYLPDSNIEISNNVDCIVDAIDTVSAKLHLIEVSKQRNIPIVSCMGMGNRYDPTQITIGDLFETTNCPLCRVMRRELRKRGITSLRCIYSKEKCELQKENGQSTIGSLPYVPSVAGLFLAYEVVNILLKASNMEGQC